MEQGSLLSIVAHCCLDHLKRRSVIPSHDADGSHYCSLRKHLRIVEVRRREWDQALENLLLNLLLLLVAAAEARVSRQHLLGARISLDTRYLAILAQ